VTNFRGPFVLTMAIIVLALSIVYGQSGIVQEEQDFRFAHQLAEKGMTDIAALQFFRFTQIYPTSLRAPEALLRAGENYELADSSFKAANIYLSLLLQFPESPLVDNALFKRANILANKNDFMQAAFAFERLKLIAPESDLVPAAQIKAAKQFINANELQKSLNALYFLLEDYPTHPLRFEARYLIAQTRKKQGKLGLASQELDKISGERLDDYVLVNAALLRSEIYAINGRQTKADSVLWSVVESSVENDSVGTAALTLAYHLQQQGDYNSSNKVVTKTLGKKISNEIYAKLLLLKGDNNYITEDFARALNDYNSVQFQDIPEKLKIRLAFRKGFIQKKLGDKNAAVQTFKSIFNSIDSTGLKSLEVISQKILIETATLLAQLDRPLEAIFLMRDNLDKLDVALRDKVIFKMANIQELHQSDYVGADRTYSTLLTLYPKSGLVDDAQFGLGRCAEKMGNTSRALGEYSRYLAQYPGADDYDRVALRLDYLQKFAPAQLHNADIAFNNLLSKNLTGGPMAPILLEWADRQIDTFHDYKKALHFLKRALVSDGNEELDKAYILYRIYYCHSLLAEMYQLKTEKNLASAHLDSALTSATILKESFTFSKWATIAAAQSVDILLEKTTSTIERITVIDSMVRSYQYGPPLDTLKHRLELKLAQEIVSIDSDSIAVDLWMRADRITSNVLLNSNNENIKSKAYLLGSFIKQQLAKDDSAIVLLEDFVKIYPNNSQIVDATFTLAELLEQRQNLVEATGFYKSIIEKYFYSDYANKARNRLSLILIRLGRADEAKQLLEKTIATLIDPQDQIYFKPVNDEKAHWIWTQAHLVGQGPLESMAVVRNFLLKSSNQAYRGYAMLDLAERAHGSYKDEIALGYYEELAETRNDTLAQIAKVKAADIYFEIGKYTNARQKFSSLKKEVSGDLLNHVSLHEVLCEYKLGNGNKAASLAKIYDNTFKDKNNKAKILYEEGMYHISKKNFKNAEKVFKTLADKYKDVPEGPRGKLGLARLYVILTKTDEALSLLTDITTQYDNPEIVANAYLNLGDFYYENRQLELCINASRKVLDLLDHGPIRALAMNLLIKSYDDVRLWDRAIALQREYIKMYPDVNNLFDRKVDIGIFLYNLKEYGRAISHLKDLKPLADVENEPRIQYWIARSYADFGDTEKAIIEYLKVKYLSKPTKLPWGVSALYEAGMGYKRLGKYDKAIELLQDVVRERGASDQIGQTANKQIQEIRLLINNS
jgi:tetratricopeptide (TPR) repeat protein